LFLFDINNIQFLFIDLLIYLIIFNSVKCNLAKCPTPLKYIFKIKYYFIILLLFYYYLCKNYMQKNFKNPFIFYFFFFFLIFFFYIFLFSFFLNCLVTTYCSLPTNLDSSSQLHCVPCSIFSLVSVSSIA